MVSSLPLACVFEAKYVDGAFCFPRVCIGMECGKNGSRLDKPRFKRRTCNVPGYNTTSAESEPEWRTIY